MTAIEAFKLGFIKECAARGVLPDQLDAMLTKWADVKRAGVAGTAAEGIKELLGGLSKATFVGLPALSALAGWGLGSQTKTTDEDMKAMEQTALVNEYRDAVRRLKLQDPHVKAKRKPRTTIAGQTTQTVVAPETAAPMAMPKAAAVRKPVKRKSQGTAKWDVDEVSRLYGETKALNEAADRGDTIYSLAPISKNRMENGMAALAEARARGGVIYGPGADGTHYIAVPKPSNTLGKIGKGLALGGLGAGLGYGAYKGYQALMPKAAAVVTPQQKQLVAVDTRPVKQRIEDARKKTMMPAPAVKPGMPAPVVQGPR